ncbi:MAG: hypothetical protein ACRED5_00245 [Propylenella sp.]
MTNDLLIAIGLTAAAAVVIGALSASVPAPARTRIGFAAVLAAWFSVAVFLGATGVLAPEHLGTPAVGAAVALPIVAIAWLASRWPVLRNALLGIPVPVLIGVNTVRMLGFFFVALYAQGRLPEPFAPIAGWGDIAIGLTALPVAWLVARQAGAWRPTALSWNLLGLADLIVAVSLGVMSAPDSPFRVFTEGPSTSAMAALPMFIVPGFLVPLLVLTHLAVFYRLSAPAQANETLRTVQA